MDIIYLPWKSTRKHYLAKKEAALLEKARVTRNKLKEAYPPLAFNVAVLQSKLRITYEKAREIFDLLLEEDNPHQIRWNSVFDGHLPVDGEECLVFCRVGDEPTCWWGIVQAYFDKHSGWHRCEHHHDRSVLFVTHWIAKLHVPRCPRKKPLKNDHGK